MIIELKDLKLCARNPLEFYCKKTLGIYLPEKEEKEEKEFLISPLQRSFFRKSSSPEALLAVAANRGRLPTGSFKDVASLKIKEEERERRQMYQEWQIKPEEKFAIEMRDHPIEGVGTFSGVIEELSPKGLIVHAADKLPDLIRIWPLFLVVLASGKADSLLLAKDGKIKQAPKEDPKKLLVDYLTYMQWALEELSPLMPNWAASLLRGTKAEFESKVEEQEDDDETLKWLRHRSPPLSPRELFDAWAEKLRAHFAPFLRWEEGQ